MHHWFIDQTLTSITEANTLKKWLVSLSNSKLNSLSFCRLCYEVRDSKFLKAVEQRVKNSSIHEDNISYEARFARIQHFIDRIESHLKVARVLMKARDIILSYLWTIRLKLQHNIWASHRRLIERSLRLMISSIEWWQILRPVNTIKKSFNFRMKSFIFY